MQIPSAGLGWGEEEAGGGRDGRSEWWRRLGWWSLWTGRDRERYRQ